MRKLVFFTFLVFFACNLLGLPITEKNYLLFDTTGKQVYDESSLDTLEAYAKMSETTRNTMLRITSLPIKMAEGGIQNLSDSRVQASFLRHIQQVNALGGGERTIAERMRGRLRTRSATASRPAAAPSSSSRDSSTSGATLRDADAAASDASSIVEDQGTVSSTAPRTLRAKSAPLALPATTAADNYLLHDTSGRQIYNESSLALLKAIASHQKGDMVHTSDLMDLKKYQIQPLKEKPVTINTDVLARLIEHVRQATENKAIIQAQITKRANDHAERVAATEKEEKDRKPLEISSIVAKQRATQKGAQAFQRAVQRRTPTTSPRPALTNGQATASDTLTLTRGTSTALVPTTMAASAPTALATRSSLSSRTDTEGSHTEGENFLRESLEGPPIQESYLLFDGGGHQIFKLKSLAALVNLREDPTDTRRLRSALLKRVELESDSKRRNAEELAPALRYAVPATSTKADGKTFNDTEAVAALQAHVQKIQAISQQAGIIDAQGRIVPRASDETGARTVLSRAPSGSASSSNSSPVIIVENPLAAIPRATTSKSYKPATSYTEAHSPAFKDVRQAVQDTAAAEREASFQKSKSQQAAKKKEKEDLEKQETQTRKAAAASAWQAGRYQTGTPKPLGTPSLLTGPTHGITTSGSLERSPANTSGLASSWLQEAPAAGKESSPVKSSGASIEQLSHHPSSPVSPQGSPRSLMSDGAVATSPGFDGSGALPTGGDGFATGSPTPGFTDTTQDESDFGDDSGSDGSSTGSRTPASHSRSNSIVAVDSLDGASPASYASLTNGGWDERYAAQQALMHAKGQAEEFAKLARKASDEATRALAQVAAQQNSLRETRAALQQQLAQQQAAAASTSDAPAVDHGATIAEMRTQLTALQERQTELAGAREELAAVKQEAQAAQERLRSNVLEVTERGVDAVRETTTGLKSALDATHALADRALKAAHAEQEKIAGILTRITTLEESRLRQRKDINALREQQEAQKRVSDDLATALDKRLKVAESTSLRAIAELTAHQSTAQKAAERAAAEKAALEARITALEQQSHAPASASGSSPAAPGVTQAELTAQLETQLAPLRRQLDAATAAQAASKQQAEQMEQTLATLTAAKAAQETEIADLRAQVTSAKTRENLHEVSKRVEALENSARSVQDTVRTLGSTSKIARSWHNKAASRPGGGSPQSSPSSLQLTRVQGTSQALIPYTPPAQTFGLTTPVKAAQPAPFKVQVHGRSNVWTKRRSSKSEIEAAKPSTPSIDYRDMFVKLSQRLAVPAQRLPAQVHSGGGDEHKTKTHTGSSPATAKLQSGSRAAQTFLHTVQQSRNATPRAHAYHLVPYKARRQ